MTTTIFVKARAYGALVTTSTVSPGEQGHNVTSEEVVLSPWEERQFHVDFSRGERVEVREADPPKPEAEASVDPRDTDADGRDDVTGRFVPGENHPASSTRKGR